MTPRQWRYAPGVDPRRPRLFDEFKVRPHPGLPEEIIAAATEHPDGSLTIEQDGVYWITWTSR
ncbi:hypothetical protein [Pseudonocardia sp. T1-2H]|uniref:hypothetical protein n=1 Tax=Pseudonocardia sp. T1-2H TaxID=3128899 RepID=UPI003101459E